ncbi:hypothetical protein BDZ45DRAFT_184898 [Acephala macrosclerotiorum]|nr:hypothetical protein BDZ45DRAFT_184898 [Acephala macrosclerotiorum]
MIARWSKVTLTLIHPPLLCQGLFLHTGQKHGSHDTLWEATSTICTWAFTRMVVTRPSCTVLVLRSTDWKHTGRERADAYV